MNLAIRKVVAVQEDTLIEGGRPVPSPFRFATAAAVFSNPWKGFVEDLQSIVHANAPGLAELLISRTVPLIGGPSGIVALGKTAVVGTNGEVEHAAAFIHTLHFGNAIRAAAAATSFMPFTNKRGGPGCTITVPLKHKIKEQEGSRAHFLTTEIVIPDAPGPDELVVALAFATSGRPHHRIGDRYQDAKAMEASCN
jgi:Amino acid synthesis